MKLKSVRLAKLNKGQALVETVIVLPLILLILFAVISIGIYIYDLTVFTMASNKGLDTRMGISGNTEISDKDIYTEKKAVKYAKLALFVDNIEAHSTVNSDENTITVMVEGDFNCILPFVNDIFKKIFHLESECIYEYDGNDS